MLVLTCYVPGQLRQETVESLTLFGPSAQICLHQLDPGDDLAYRNILASYWQRGESFIVVEPDIVVRPDVVEACLTCECEYGCFPYAWLTDVGPALGCTWFHGPFLAEHPGALREVGNVSWRQLDVVLMRHVLARRYGKQPHVHLPAVEHLNPKKQLLPEANPEPLMEVPHW